jgi:hypothetical protein
MPLDMPTYLATRRKFLANRAAFPATELMKYSGQWVAWSPDGTRVVACAPDPKMLDAILQACGEDPASCVVEGIPGDDCIFGEADGSGA